MNFKHSKNLALSADSVAKISAISWSTNLMRLAVAQSDKRIALYDENGEKKETFSTKPGPKNSKSYMIRELCFSPDSIKLAVAQSDNIVFIYKLGSQWGDKKAICNKFEQNSPVTCMVWPPSKPVEIFFGVAEGKVKIGTLKNNNSSVLYTTDSYVVSISSSPDGKFLLSGHLDGVIYKYNFETSNLQKMVIHSSIPYCLAWGNDILAAGNDYKVIFYNDIGTKLQTFDYSNDDKLKEFTICKANPSGDCIAIGNFNRFYVYLYNTRRSNWEETSSKIIEGLYSVTSLCWKPDGSSLVIGNLCGSVDLFAACLKKFIYKEKFEVTYVSHTQIVIKDLTINKRLVIKPHYSTEITKINIYLDNFVVLTTRESLILGDIEMEKCSELNWTPSGNEKFDFSNPNVCMIYHAGELTLVEYGNNDILGYCRTEYIHSNLISARLNYNNMSIGKNSTIKVISYLIDLNTIYIQDLTTQSIIANISHDSKIDFLELNKNGSKLIFRDRKRHLYLYYVFENRKVTLLNFCGYVQWVPNSEVLVAQERKNLCVWYNVEDPDKVKIINIKGEVDEVRRREGKTEVIVEEGNNSQTYLLDDGLIAFSTAIDDNDLNKAVKILESLEMTTDTETHWKTLAKLSIASKNLIIAQRCYAAIGSYSKANYIKKVIKIAEKCGPDHPLVIARLLILDKQFNNAESLLLQNNLLDEAMEILNELQKWDESVKIAEKYSHPEIKTIKKQYYEWLLDNDQLDRAAELKEREGDYLTAIKLYISGGYPAKAANLIKNYDFNFTKEIIEQTISALIQVGIHEKAGELLELIGHYQRSLDCYIEAKCFSKAVEIAKKYMTDRVERLEEEWGDYLFAQKKIEAAIMHFIEAGAKDKAIEAAIQARKWEKAIELCNTVSLEIARQYFVDIGEHFAQQRQLDVAEKYFIKAKEPAHAFNMYVKNGKWDKAEQIIKKNLKDEEFGKVIIKEALKYEHNSRFKEAEKLYIMAGEHDMAINMYKIIKQYDNMLRLVSLYRPDFLKNTHIMVAQLLESEKNFKQAEQHFIEAGNWKAAADMYRIQNMWEEALRVAKANGSKGEINEFAKRWITNANIPKDQASKMLLSNGLVEACIDIECEKKNFDQAFELANKHAKYKVQDVHLKYAMELEDEKRYHDAEEHYIKAGQVQEVISMYEHTHDYQSALRVARQHNDPNAVINIYMNQGKFFIERKEFAKAEVCFVNAKSPETMVKEYFQIQDYQSCLKFARKYVPHMVQDISTQISMLQDKVNMSGNDLLENAKLCEDGKDFIRAIDIYLEINENHFSDHDNLESIWEKAVNIALENDKARAGEIIMQVAVKLRNIKRYLNSATLFENIGQLDEACKCYIHGKYWDKAKNIIEDIRNPEVKKQLKDLYQRNHKTDLIEKNDDEGIVDVFKDETGLEMMIEKREYDKCLEYANRISAEMFNKYLILIVKKYLQDKNLAGAAEFLETHNTPIYKYNLELYKELALEILAEENLDELKYLKGMLACAMKNLAYYTDFPNEAKFLARLNKAAYLQFMKFSMKQRKNEFSKSYYRVCLSILAYGDIVKLDLALLDAGNICREIGLKGNAFILLNRYLDIYEAIEDPTNKLEEETALKETEITQEDAFKSDVNIISTDQRDEIHEWIMKISIDKSVEKALNKQKCIKCAKEIFDANTICKNCSFGYETCIVSGFPIHRSNDAVTCTSCNKKALKECWKEWLSAFEQCPFCKSIQVSYK